jgi:DNA polymerase-3 subunit epsilon
METDPNGLSTFIQKELNPKRLHPNLDVDALEDIPNKIGVYKFFNDVNQLIYIGKSIHIKKRIDQHLRNSKTKKGLQMQQEIARIEYELTGSELIALLYESEQIKHHQPIYNRSLKRNQFPYGLFTYTDEKGYARLFVGRVAGTNEIPLTTFTTKREGTNYLERMVDEYDLCTKLCDLYKTNSACFQYTVKNCLGACVQEELSSSYNRRAQSLIEQLNFDESTFYIVDKGRHRGEKSLILIKNGILTGHGYAPYHFRSSPIHKWEQYIDLVTENRDSKSILKLFLRKNKTHDVVNIMD